MQVNKNKVIVLPKAFQKEQSNFVCPCQVCLERAEKAELQYFNMQEIKSSIESILDSTPLYAKDFQIDISYVKDGRSIDPATTIPLSGFPELDQISASIKLISDLTTQFNQKYRHPLICELINISEMIDTNISLYKTTFQGRKITSDRLWDFQEIISLIDDMLSVLSEIHQEQIILNTKIDSLSKRIKAVRKTSGQQLREMFIQGINSDEVVPLENTDSRSLDYGY